MKPEWRFRVMAKGEVNQNPIHDTFFDSEEMRSAVDALVREDNQNHLDASIGKGPVLIRVFFPQSHQFITGAAKENILQNLLPHVKAGIARGDTIPRTAEPLSYLLIEDFGTKGLIGDPLLDDDPGPSVKNDFYYFFRNVGRSQKGEMDRGRWGIGKVVYPASSRIQAFLALTTRSDDGKTLAMGHAVLEQHNLSKNKFCPFGYFGVFPEKSSPHFVYPIVDLAELKSLRTQFHMRRKDESGLSLIILYPVDDLKPEDYVRSTIKHYFLPILTGDLQVQVSIEGEEIQLSRDTLLSVLMRKGLFDVNEQEKYRGLFNLVGWYKTQLKAGLLKLNHPNLKDTPKWSEGLFPNGILELTRKSFEDGKPVGFRVPLRISPMGKDPRESFFDIILQKDEKLNDVEEYFVRRGLTISGEKFLKERGIRGIVIIDNPALSGLLGDAENPAHTEWQKNGKKFRGKYDKGPSCLMFVKHSLREIVKMLTRHESRRSDDLLEDIFSVPRDTPEPDEPDEAKQKPPKKKPRKKPIPSDWTPPRWAITQIRGGFCLSSVPDISDIPETIRITVAYETVKGNAFEQYHPLDFDLNDPSLTLTCTGAKYKVEGPNVIQVAPDSTLFELCVSGFDENRDVIVDAE